MGDFIYPAIFTLDVLPGKVARNPDPTPTEKCLWVWPNRLLENSISYVMNIFQGREESS